METITISSPSPILRTSIHSSPLQVKSRSRIAVRNAGSSAARGTTGRDPDASTKPKQSKSRNGCHTCKKKRLKCDETKPTCQQCQRRKVLCEGYQKNFKWRTTGLQEATAPHSREQDSKQFNNGQPDFLQPCSRSQAHQEPHRAAASEEQPFAERPTSLQSAVLPAEIATTPYTYPVSISPYNPFPGTCQSAPTPCTPNSVSEAFPNHPLVPIASPLFARHPALDPDDPLSFEAYLAQPHHYLATPPRNLKPIGKGSNPAVKIASGQLDEDDDGVEEISRVFEIQDSWTARSHSPPISDFSFGSDGGDSHLFAHHIQLDQHSPELLMSRFDRDTCGIMSVKDGRNENPWRTMIWPLARNSDSAALYHAIHAMAAFHASNQAPSLHLEGMSHMQRSLIDLRNGISNMTLSTETALATTLALAFSVSWDQKTSTGSEHLRGASALVEDALIKYKQNDISPAESERLRFLCNTWIYMDVLARLTKLDGSISGSRNRLIAPLPGPISGSDQIDPLMGCASTLFPLIGRVANLVGEVHDCPENSIKIISCGTELKEALEGWAAPTSFEAPEDPDCAVQHSLQTAEAYRWATLLYLHQAVPELSSQSSAFLARKVLICLATVPITSRAVIVHIYPLLAAGCEFVGQEERDWIENRWQQMMQRMLIGNVEKCLEVTREVWKRRNAKAVQKQKQMQSRSTIPRRSTGFMVPVEQLKRRFTGGSDASSNEDTKADAWKRRRTDEAHEQSTDDYVPLPSKSCGMDMVENLDVEETVRGRLHWLGVMKDWRWEVLLG